MWHKEIADLEILPPKKIADWMRKPHKMGEAMRRVCSKLTLKVVEQTFGQPLKDEIPLLELGSNSTSCLLRRIILMGDDIPFSFGNVVIPKEVYLDNIVKFDSLGNQLIGETILYNDPETVREPFQYAYIDKNHPLYAIVLASCKTDQSDFWGRRSLFKLNGSEPLLITEIFFNGIPEYK